MILGNGRVVRQLSERELLVRSFPILGEWIYDMIWKPTLLTTDEAPNQFGLICGSAGSGKSNFTKKLINDQFKKGGSFLCLDAAGDLRDYTIQRAVELDWPPQKFVLIDFFPPQGMSYPVIDFLEDDPNDDLSPYQLCEELVTATSLISTSRSIPGARELDLARMCWLPLILTKKPFTHIARFLLDEAYRNKVVLDSGHVDLEMFWLGKDSYFKRLDRQGQVLESIRNKFNPLVLHPALKRVLNHKGSSFDLFEFIQNGGVVVVDLSEHKLKYEIRLTISHLIQYWFRVNILKRQRTDHRPLFTAFLDEFPQYKTPATIDLTRIARQLGLSLLFLVQDLGILDHNEYRTLMSNCATLIAMNSSQQDAQDMAYQLFLRDGSTYRDWEGTRNYSSQDELTAYVSMIMQLEQGQAIARVKPSKDAYFLDIPLVPKPHVSDQKVHNFLCEMAKLWYR